MAQKKILGNQLNISDVALDVAADPAAVASLEGTIDHANIVNGGGTNSHADIDAHIAQGSPAIHNTFTDIVQDTSPQLGANLDVNGFNIVGVYGSGSPAFAGPISIIAGSSLNTAGGAVTISGGNNVTGEGAADVGGAVTISGGTGYYGGNVEIVAGDAVFQNGSSGHGGSINLTTGYSQGYDSGGISLTTSGTTNTTVGNISIITGSSGDGNTGNISITTGTASGLGDPGNINLTAGTGSQGNGGDINLTAGSGNQGNGGNVSLTPGVSSLSSDGEILLHSAAGAVGQASIQFWDDTNVGHTTGNYVALKAPSFVGSTNITYILPELDGDAGDVMLTDGGGNLSFGPWVLPKFTVGTLPLVVEGGQIYVTDAIAAGGSPAPIGAQCFGRGVGSPLLTEWVDVTTGLAVV